MPTSIAQYRGLFMFTDLLFVSCVMSPEKNNLRVWKSRKVFFFKSPVLLSDCKLQHPPTQRSTESLLHLWGYWQRCCRHAGNNKHDHFRFVVRGFQSFFWHARIDTFTLKTTSSYFLPWLGCVSNLKRLLAETCCGGAAVRSLTVFY